MYKIKKVNSPSININSEKFSYDSKNKNNLTTINKTNNNKVEIVDVDVDSNSNLYSSTINYENIKTDGYTVQGYTTYNGKTIISAYNHDGKKSRIYVYDNISGELTQTIILNNTDHVGGISVDDTNGILYVTQKDGTIGSYDLKKLDEELGGEKLIDFSTGNYDKFKIENNINTGQDEATLYWYNGKLYTATYGLKSTIKEINVSYENGKINASIKTVSKEFASTTQGIAVYKDKNKNEYIFAAGSTKGLRSRIRVYKKEGDNYERISSYESKLEGLEGIKINNNGNLTGICEYGEQSVKNLGNVSYFINHSNKQNYASNALRSAAGLWWDQTHK